MLNFPTVIPLSVRDINAENTVKQVKLLVPEDLYASVPKLHKSLLKS